ncbi:Gliding motility-associated ABC transporter ATP-binding protein GldA [hydrothermal vent metagenome]|uniref:Gliding motility-associated ABC transporter ATP-binding protein GldA n=1 Tax=hydrothermal vent metagenome TaxID=652676 RepID=A0A3B1BX17_9ZZZZ
MIEVENLTKRYGGFTAVDDISFKIEKGEICGFLGPNGAGKTSTMRIITGFMPPTLGKAKVAGFQVTDSPYEVKKRVGYLPESTPLYTDMRVAEYLNFVAKIKGLRGQSKIKAVAQVMEDTALTDRQRSLIGSLSKGYRQRVGLSQALLNDPEVLVLDEPSIGLDPMQITEIRGLIKNLSGMRTVILSTHILPEAQMICSRVIIINKGKILAADTPENLSRRLERGGRITARIEAPEGEALAAIKNIPGVQDVAVAHDEGDLAGAPKYYIDPAVGENPRKKLLKLLVEKDWDLTELTETSFTLEEIYLKVVAEDVQKREESQ